MLKITSAASSNIGKIKSVNGDNFYLNESFLTEVTSANGAVYLDDATRRVQYYAVFDGFDEDVRSELNYNARFADGNAASKIAAEEMLKLQSFVKKSKEYDLDRLVHIYASKTNRIMNNYTKEHKVRIGASFALLCIDSGMIKAYNVGNVKIFMLRDNRLINLTTDDTKVEMFAASGRIASSAVGGAEVKILTQHLGHNEEGLSVHTAKMDRMKSGDKFLICTDSICRYISKQKLHNLITLDISEQEILNEIMAESSRQGGDDNYTAVIVEVGNAEKPTVNTSGGAVKGFIPLMFKKPVRFKPAQLKALAWIALCCLIFVITLAILFTGPLKYIFGDEEETDASDNVSNPTSNDTLPSDDGEPEEEAGFTDPTEPTADTGTEQSESNTESSTNDDIQTTRNTDPTTTATTPTTTKAPNNNNTTIPPTTTTPPPTTTAAPTTTVAPTTPPTTTNPPTTTAAPTTTTEPATTTAEPETTTAPQAVTETEPPPTEPTVGEAETVGAWTD